MKYLNDTIEQPIILMCEPTHYRILEAEPPWRHYNDQSKKGFEIFQQDKNAFLEKAHEQWSAYKRLLEDKLNAKVVTVAPNPALADQVFAADASVSLIEPDREFSFLSYFTHPKRQKEVLAHEALIRKMFPLREIVAIDRPLEGQGDNVYDPVRDVFWSGYTAKIDHPAAGRSSKAAHRQLKQVCGFEIHSIHVMRPFFHVDTCLAPLSGGHMLVYKTGMDSFSYDMLIEKAFMAFDLSITDYLIEVTEEEAYQYACNVVNIGNKIIMPPCGERLPNILSRLGYDVFEVDLSQFIYGGGGPHCLVNYLNQPRRQALAR